MARRKLDSCFTHFPALIGVLSPVFSGQGRAVSRVAGEWTQVVSGHQELTADLPRLPASLFHYAPSQLSSDRWCESSRRQSRTIRLHHHRFATEEGKRTTTLAPNSDRAPGRPALRHGRSSHSAGAAARWREVSRGEVNSRATFGASAERSVWGQFAVGIQEQRRQQQEQEGEEEEEEESRPFQRRSPGDASVNARAMSRRKQGNPQHLSQREITRKYTSEKFTAPHHRIN